MIAAKSTSEKITTLLRTIKENTDNLLYIVGFNALNKYLQLKVSMVEKIVSAISLLS